VRHSLALRLAMMFAACAAAVFALGGWLLHGSLGVALDRQLHEELSLRATLIDSVVGKVGSAQEWREKVAPKLDAMAATNGAARVWIEGNARFSHGAAPPGLAGRVVQQAGFAAIPVEGEPCDLVTLVHLLPAQGERPPMRLVLATSSSPFVQTADTFRAALVGVLLAGVGVAAALGYWIARIGLWPLARLCRQARALSPANRSQRLGLRPMPTELSNLTASFNGALERLEQACGQLEAFNADVAHELRTPLTNLIGQTQVVLSRGRSADELQEVLQSNLEEFERMRSIVNDMLFLARADRGALAGNPARVSLCDEMRKVVEFLEPMAEERGVKVSVHGDAQVEVETALVRRALSNLLQNAIEHSAEGAEVVARVEVHDGMPRLAVSNPGRCIDDAHLPHLFERFYRADPSRANSGANHGLGLSIVKAVATMHRGAVFARSEAGWNTFGFTVSPVR
jgi:two-component system heavy metal sensor histidine kinase CusS